MAHGSTPADPPRLDQYVATWLDLVDEVDREGGGSAPLSASSQTARSATAAVQPPNIPFIDS